MNSKQRRHRQRYWKYVVDYPFQRYSSVRHSELLEEMEIWCKRYIGTMYYGTNGWATSKWYFRREQDAVLFKLRWQ